MLYIYRNKHLWVEFELSKFDRYVKISQGQYVAFAHEVAITQREWDRYAGRSARISGNHFTKSLLVPILYFNKHMLMLHDK